MSFLDYYRLGQEDRAAKKKVADQKRFGDIVGQMAATPDRTALFQQAASIDPQGAMQAGQYFGQQDQRAKAIQDAKDKEAATMSLYKIQAIRTAPDEQKVGLIKQYAPDAAAQISQAIGRDPTPQEINAYIDQNSAELYAKSGLPPPKPDVVSATTKAELASKEKVAQIGADSREGIAASRQSAAAGGADTYAQDPALRRTAAIVVASDPTRMRDYATYGSSGQAIRTTIQKEISQLKKETGMSDSDFVRARANAKAAAGNLNTLTKQSSQVQAAEQLAHANGDRLLQLFDLVDQTGIPLIEGITRSARAKTGGVDAAELKSVMTAFQTEVSRVLSGNPNMTGVVSDSLRQEIQKMAPESMSADQAKRVIKRLYTEMQIRQDAIQQQMTNSGNATVVNGQAPEAVTPTANRPPLSSFQK